MKALMLFAALPLLLAAGPIQTSPELGKAEGRCRAGESGPALLVSAVGLKDHSGLLKLEVYPANDADFLRDDNQLLMEGKTFRRVEVPTPGAATPELCIRVPGPGSYSVVLLHDRDMNHKFGWTVDGIGFASNPHLGWSKPKASATRAYAGSGLTHLSIVLNYRRGFGVAPLAR